MTRLIFMLTLRQLTGGRRFMLMVLLALIPIAVAAIGRGTDTDAREFADGIVNVLLISVILPVVMLTLASATFGHEVEDETLGYLMLKPVARWKIALPKVLAPVATGGALVAVSGIVTVLLLPASDPAGVAAIAVALLVGAAAYAAVFAWAGLITRSALLFGLAYAFIWEATLTNFLSGIRFLSVRQYTLAILRGMDRESLSSTQLDILGLPVGLAGAGLTVAVFFALTVWRLRTMDVP